MTGPEVSRKTPLADVRIVALEQYGAGPFGSLHLAELGAEVIKIEDPNVGGDVGRYVVPFQHGEHSLFFESFNRNKRSISLDVQNAAGRRIFEELVRHADVVYSNLRGDVPGALHIRYDDLKHLNPAIVCCSLSGFGMTGPRSAEPGYDYILQGLAGWMTLTGEPDGPPEKTGLSLVDYSGGLVAAVSILSALHAARRDGIGSDCDVALYDTALSMLTYLGTWALTMTYIPERTKKSAHPSLVPFQNFETADGWIVLGCAKEKFWRRLVEVLGVDELHDTEKFGSFRARGENREKVLGIVQDRLREKPTDEWLDLFRPAGIPCGPINGVVDALKDAHTKARGMIVETEHPDFGTVRHLASAVRVGPPGHDIRATRRAPFRNEDATYVLRELLGYDEAQIERMANEGAFGDPQGHS